MEKNSSFISDIFQKFSATNEMTLIGAFFFKFAEQSIGSYRVFWNWKYEIISVATETLANIVFSFISYNM